MEIPKETHLSNLLGSLNKLFINAKTKGVIRNKELFLLDTINELLTKCDILTTKQRKDLVTMYYNILNKYSFLCKYHIKPSNYNYTRNHTYVHDEGVFTTTVTSKIYYWQETDVLRIASEIENDVRNNNYLDNKPTDTMKVFADGKDIDYVNTGRICFAISDVVTTEDYRIYDILDNDITHTFDKIQITELNVILFISDNIYAYGLINFEIRKPI